MITVKMISQRFAQVSTSIDIVKHRTTVDFGEEKEISFIFIIIKHFCFEVL